MNFFFCLVCFFGCWCWCCCLGFSNWNEKIGGVIGGCVWVLKRDLRSKKETSKDSIIVFRVKYVAHWKTPFCFFFLFLSFNPTNLDSHISLSLPLLCAYESEKKICFLNFGRGLAWFFFFFFLLGHFTFVGIHLFRVFFCCKHPDVYTIAVLTNELDIKLTSSHEWRGESLKLGFAEPIKRGYFEGNAKH